MTLTNIQNPTHPNWYMVQQKIGERRYLAFGDTREAALRQVIEEVYEINTVTCPTCGITRRNDEIDPCDIPF